MRCGRSRILDSGLFGAVFEHQRAMYFSNETQEAEVFSGPGLSGTGTLLQTFSLGVSDGLNGIVTDIATFTIPVSLPLESGNFSLGERSGFRPGCDLYQSSELLKYADGSLDGSDD